MKKIVSILSMVVVVWPLAVSWAQLAPPNEAGVAMGHLHTIVRDVEASKKFWTTLGGSALKIGDTDVVKLPGLLVFISQGNPTGGNYGAVVNHVGFRARSHEAVVAKLKAAGLTAELGKGFNEGNPLGWGYTPDNLKVRLNSDESIAGPIGSPGVQVWLAQSSLLEMQAWYVKMFGAKARQPNPQEELHNIGVEGIPGVRIVATTAGQTAQARTPRAVGLVNGALPDQAYVDRLPANLGQPMKGRTLDHIGFEVTNLEAFCKKLEANGVKFEEPYSKARHKDYASAKLTDPWGISIELTEGLRRF